MPEFRRRKVLLCYCGCPLRLGRGEGGIGLPFRSGLGELASSRFQAREKPHAKMSRLACSLAARVLGRRQEPRASGTHRAGGGGPIALLPCWGRAFPGRERKGPGSSDVGAWDWQPRPHIADGKVPRSFPGSASAILQQSEQGSHGPE